MTDFMKDSSSTSKCSWKVWSGYDADLDYRDWDLDFIAYCKIRKISFILDDSYKGKAVSTKAEAKADEAKKDESSAMAEAMGILFHMTDGMARKIVQDEENPRVALDKLHEKISRS